MNKKEIKPVKAIFPKSEKKQLDFKRIGIFSGSFDPVHKGHVAFALQAIEKANLDFVYFLPERKPINKPEITHFAHRIKMLELAIRAHSKLKILELEGNKFTVNITLPKIRKRFKNDRLIFLMGSDLFENIQNWPDIKKLLSEVGLIIGARGSYEVSESLEHAKNLPCNPLELTIIDSIEREISSSQIRTQLSKNLPCDLILQSVRQYAIKEWLYNRIS